MRKFVCAAVVTLFTFGVALGDEFFARITKVDDGKVTFTKAKKGEKGEEMTLPLAKTAKLVKGKFNKETKSIEAGDPLEREAVTKIMDRAGEKGVFAFIVTDADNKRITEIRFLGGKKKKKKSD
jgi:hypothetical protein